VSATSTRYAYDTATEVQIKAHWCGGCGIPYGLPAGFLAARREDGQNWTCPNGCVRHFPPGGSKAEQLEKELEAARSLAAREARRRQNAEDQARDAEYRRRAAKGQLTKAKKRIANGVCPCCNRTFKNLADHMAGQHPEYVIEDGSDG
jgi:hypothetical protein